LQHILIIEDDEIIREELMQFLENNNYKILAPDSDTDIIDIIRKENSD